MPRRSFRIVKKSGSFKKRRGAIGKKSKVQRKRGSRRRIKMIVGGAAWLNEQTDLSVVWNSLFYERVKTQFKDFFPRINPEDLETPASGTKSKVLFVIDMQKDFVDRVYQRDTAKGDKHPVYINLPHNYKPLGTDAGLSGGNFAVTDAINMLGGSKTDEEAIQKFGSPEIADKIIEKSEFLKHIKDALEKDSEYTHVIFSRDYHPVGHCSFNNRWFKEETLCVDCTDGGNFPAHCVQGFEGSKFLPEIEYLIKTYGGTKAKVVFKGVHKQCDSFTAVKKNAIDYNASNVKNTNPCSTMSGAYLAPTGFDVFGVDKFITESLSSLTYKTGSELDLSSATHIEVCGLAGDYCVRDTVVALAEMFEDKKIILLGDYTRYPTLPFFSIGILPHHNYKKYGSINSILPILSEYDKSLIPENKKIDAPPVVQSYEDIKSHFEDTFEYANFDNYRKSRALPLLEYALLNTQFLQKDIIYYLLTKSGPTESLKLMASGELDNASANDLVANAFCEHFITPFQAIIDDYNPKTNIYIKMKFLKNL